MGVHRLQKFRGYSEKDANDWLTQGDNESTSAFAERIKPLFFKENKNKDKKYNTDENAQITSIDQKIARDEQERNEANPPAGAMIAIRDSQGNVKMKPASEKGKWQALGFTVE